MELVDAADIVAVVAAAAADESSLDAADVVVVHTAAAIAPVDELQGCLGTFYFQQYYLITAPVDELPMQLPTPHLLELCENWILPWEVSLKRQAGWQGGHQTGGRDALTYLPLKALPASVFSLLQLPKHRLVGYSPSPSSQSSFFW